MGETSGGDVAITSLSNLAHLLKQRGDQPRVLYRYFQNEAWQDFTAAQVIEMAGAWQAAFQREGFQSGDRVALCMRNGVHWVAIDMAALGMGLIVVPLYVDDNAENIAYCVENSGAKLLIVDQPRQAKQLAETKFTLPPVICLRAREDDAVATVEQFLTHCSGPFTVSELPAHHLATICYTSGTSGKPKGVMLSHANILANVDSCAKTKLATPEMTFLSLLPLSHMFERTGGYYLPLAVGARVVYTRGVPQLAEDLKQQGITTMFVAPRVLERLHARIVQGLKEQGKLDLFNRLCDAAWRVQLKQGSIIDRITVFVLQRIMGRKILAKIAPSLGLLISGGAALSSAVAKTFVGIGLPVLQGYGMTEAAPVLSVNRYEDNDPETVGRALPNVTLKISETGELYARGANVMQGYWNNPEATAKVIDAEGWLHTGDLAEEKDGRYAIRGRSKDILVLSNGEKFSPQDAELAILGDAAFEQVMLIGEGRAFITLACVTQLTDIKEIVRRANAQLKGFPRWVKVRHAIATTEAWSVDNALLTPTLKVKRSEILKRFAPQIEAAYAQTSEE